MSALGTGLRNAFMKAFPRIAVALPREPPGHATDAIFIGVINVLTPYYDVERFGAKLGGVSQARRRAPRLRPVTRQIVPHVKRLWEPSGAQARLRRGSCACGEASGTARTTSWERR